MGQKSELFKGPIQMNSGTKGREEGWRWWSSGGREGRVKGEGVGEGKRAEGERAGVGGVLRYIRMYLV